MDLPVSISTPRRLRSTIGLLLEAVPCATRRGRWICNSAAVLMLLVGLTWAAFTFPIDQLLGFQGIVALVLSAGSWAILSPVADPTIGLTPFEIAGIVMFQEILLVLLVTGNFRALFRVPWLGKRLRRVAAKSALLKRRFPHFQRYAVVAVTLFVIIPVPGSGSIGGCVLASLLGLTPPVAAAAVLVGCAFENFALATFTDVIAGAMFALRATPWFDVVRVLFFALFAILVVAAARLMARLMAEPAAPAPVAEPTTPSPG